MGLRPGLIPNHVRDFTMENDYPGQSVRERRIDRSDITGGGMVTCRVQLNLLLYALYSTVIYVMILLLFLSLGFF